MSGVLTKKKTKTFKGGGWRKGLGGERDDMVELMLAIKWELIKYNSLKELGVTEKKKFLSRVRTLRIRTHPQQGKDHLVCSKTGKAMLSIGKK